MALRKEKPEAIQLYKKLLLIFAFVTVALSALLEITSLLLALAAAVFALPAVFLWKHTAVRVVTRTLTIVLLASSPLLLLVLAVSGMFQTEYIFTLVCIQAALPMMAVAANNGKKCDIVLLQVVGVLQAVAAGSLCAYILSVQKWVVLVLFAINALVMLLLPFMAHGISHFFKKKA